VLVLQDNARLHTICQTAQTPISLEFYALPHLTYSLDLAPLDYALFDKVKDPLHYQFPDSNDLWSSVCKTVCTILKDWFAASIINLKERWQWCIGLSWKLLCWSVIMRVSSSLSLYSRWVTVISEQFSYNWSSGFQSQLIAGDVKLCSCYSSSDWLGF
jgi:hypothetical protein